MKTEKMVLNIPLICWILLTAGSALLDHKLILTIDFPVMLLRYINPFKGHMNGVRCAVKAVHTSLFILESLKGHKAGKIFDMPKMPNGLDDSSFPIQGFTGTQFPVTVYFTITINQAPGQPFCKLVRLDLSNTIFLLGRMYVGPPTVPHPNNLKVRLFPNMES